MFSSKIMASLPSSTPLRAFKKYCSAVRSVRWNNSKRPIPDPNAQGGNRLAELRSYKQAYTSSLPLTADNSRVEESPASLVESGSKGQTVYGGKPNYL